MYYNKCTFVGRLTRDPEMRFTSTGVAVANFNLAVDRPFVNAQGERETDFIPVTVWRKLAETCANNLGKGRLVLVEGRLQVAPIPTRKGLKGGHTDHSGQSPFLDGARRTVRKLLQTDIRMQVQMFRIQAFPAIFRRLIGPKNRRSRAIKLLKESPQIKQVLMHSLYGEG